MDKRCDKNCDCVSCNVSCMYYESLVDKLELHSELCLALKLIFLMKLIMLISEAIHVKCQMQEMLEQFNSFQYGCFMSIFTFYRSSGVLRGCIWCA